MRRGPLASRAPRPAAARALLALALPALLAACGKAEPPPSTSPPPRPPASASVQFTQVLIGYRVEGRTPFRRSRGEALEVAERTVARARAGEPMERLVAELTDDRDEKGQPFNRGSYTIAKADPRVVRVLRDAILDTRVGEVHPRPVDTGLAFVVFRRDR